MSGGPVQAGARILSESIPATAFEWRRGGEALHRGAPDIKRGTELPQCAPTGSAPSGWLPAPMSCCIDTVPPTHLQHHRRHLRRCEATRQIGLKAECICHSSHLRNVVERAAAVRDVELRGSRRDKDAANIRRSLLVTCTPAAPFGQMLQPRQICGCAAAPRRQQAAERIASVINRKRDGHAPTTDLTCLVFARAALQRHASTGGHMLINGSSSSIALRQLT